MLTVQVKIVNLNKVDCIEKYKLVINFIYKFFRFSKLRWKIDIKVKIIYVIMCKTHLKWLSAIEKICAMEELFL